MVIFASFATVNLFAAFLDGFLSTLVIILSLIIQQKQRYFFEKIINFVRLAIFSSLNSLWNDFGKFGKFGLFFYFLFEVIWQNLEFNLFNHQKRKQ